MDTDLIRRALAFAADKHRDHKRRYTGDPYLTHLVAVANMVAAHMPDPEVIAAALLHDTLEDTATTFGELEAAFGLRVATLVNELTDVFVLPEHGNRKARKALEAARLATTCADAHLIKLADLIDNTKTIVEHDPGFARVYLREKRALLDVLIKGPADLRAKAAENL